MMALLPSPLQMFVLLRQPAKNLILMRLWKVVQGFSFWKMEPCSHPKWGFGKKKPQTLNPLHNLWCVSVPGSLYLHYLFPASSLQQDCDTPREILASEGAFMPHHCHLKRGCLLSSGEQFSCITLPVPASKWVFIPRKSCCWCFCW